jgi:hypothetical protein
MLQEDTVVVKRAPIEEPDSDTPTSRTGRDAIVSRTGYELCGDGQRRNWRVTLRGKFH